MASMKLWLPIMLLISFGSSQAYDGWNELITDLAEFDGPTFRDRIANPLVELSANAYRYPDVIDVPGWILSSKVAPVAPAEGGMHALVYEEESGGADGRVVIAFRGTQIGPTVDCDADLCADAFLWVVPGGDSCAPSADKCSRFDDATLDYFSQAVDYTLMVLRAYPSASLLLTGHSLGGGLAILASAAVSTYPPFPVIAFGSAGTKTALKVRELHLNEEHLKRIVTIADQWDEIMRTTWNEQLGRVCLYEAEMSTACKNCFDSPTCILDSMIETVSDADYCMLCFFKTHYLANLIETVQKGEKPACELLA